MPPRGPSRASPLTDAGRGPLHLAGAMEDERPSAPSTPSRAQDPGAPAAPGAGLGPPQGTPPGPGAPGDPAPGLAAAGPAAAPAPARAPSPPGGGTPPRPRWTPKRPPTPAKTPVRAAPSPRPGPAAAPSSPSIDGTPPGHHHRPVQDLLCAVEPAPAGPGPGGGPPSPALEIPPLDDEDDAGTAGAAGPAPAPARRRNAGLLRELQGLAPFAWDARRGEHPVGAALGGQFEGAQVGLRGLVESGLVAPGPGALAVTVAGAEVTADLRPSGEVVFGGREFLTPGGFARAAGEPGPGWAAVTHRGAPLEDLRRRLLVEGAGAGAGAGAGGAPGAPGAAGPPQRRSRREPKPSSHLRFMEAQAEKIHERRAINAARRDLRQAEGGAGAEGEDAAAPPEGAAAAPAEPGKPPKARRGRPPKASAAKAAAAEAPAAEAPAAGEGAGKPRRAAKKAPGGKKKPPPGAGGGAGPRKARQAGKPGEAGGAGAAAGPPAPAAEPARKRPRREAASGVSYLALGSYGHHMVDCPPYRLQPFHVTMSSAAQALMDFHAHLSECEVIGLLAGTLRRPRGAARAELVVERAHPVRELAETQGTTDVEMDPGAEVAVREAIERSGRVVVGWYHSHPTFRALPSVIDITNQAIHQRVNDNGGRVVEYEPAGDGGDGDDSDDEDARAGRAGRGADRTGSREEMYVAAIVSPYGERRQVQSELLVFHVEHAADAPAPGYGDFNPLDVGYAAKALKVLPRQATAREMAELDADAGALAERYREQKGSTRASMGDRWAGEPTKFDKIVASGTGWLRGGFAESGKPRKRRDVRRLEDPQAELDGAVRCLEGWVGGLRSKWA